MAITGFIQEGLFRWVGMRVLLVALSDVLEQTHICGIEVGSRGVIVPTTKKVMCSGLLISADLARVCPTWS